MADLSDEPEGSPDDGEDYERLGTVEVDGLPIPIALTRQVAQDGTHYWSFAQVTVSHIPELHAARGPSWLARNVPESWKAGGFLGLATWQWVGVVGVLVVAFPLGWLAGILLMWGLGRLAARTPTGLDDLLVQKTRGPVRFALGWLSASVASSTLDLPARFEGWLSPLLQTPFILASGWFLAQVVRSITHSMGDLAPRTGDEGLHARRMRTQLVMLRKLAIVLIAIVTGAIVFLQFEVVRNIGVSLLASAGVVSVALGFAAQKSLGAVIAGIQLSFTQPIRIDDVVVLDDQWGTVEEINLTYVLLKLWDERRLVVPIEHFLTKVFENWSKPGSELIGIVEVAVDPTAPVSTLRDAVEAFAAAHADHDGREVALQVVDLNEHRALLRARVSTSDITKTFGLRCALREHLMRVLQDLDGGRFLPRARWQVIEGGRSAEDHRGEEGGLENERPIRDGAG
jgi:small-conductance mechanosensitive channel